MSIGHKELNSIFFEENIWILICFYLILVYLILVMMTQVVIGLDNGLVPYRHQAII